MVRIMIYVRRVCVNKNINGYNDDDDDDEDDDDDDDDDDDIIIMVLMMVTRHNVSRYDHCMMLNLIRHTQRSPIRNQACLDRLWQMKNH